MLLKFFQWLPPESVKILLVLALSLLVGSEREEHKAAVEQPTFGGVRTYPLIGLIGYAMALLGGGQLLPLALGFAVVGGFLFLSYWHKLTTSAVAGITSEVSALAIYIVGGLVYQGHFWVATTLSVASALLLELKTALEGLTKRIVPGEIFTFTKFLLLTAVILPILPNQAFGPFQINPFKTLVRCRRCEHGFLRQLRPAKADEAKRRSVTYGDPRWGVLLDRDDSGPGQASLARGPTPPFLGRHLDGVRRHVPAPGYTAGLIQLESDDQIGSIFPRAGLRGPRSGLDLVPPA